MTGEQKPPSQAMGKTTQQAAENIMVQVMDRRARVGLAQMAMLLAWAKVPEGSGKAPPAPPPKPQEPAIKAGRNDPCPCGNGKKFKKCHGRTLQQVQSQAQATRQRPVRQQIEIKGIPIEFDSSIDQEAVCTAMRNADVPEEVIYAYGKTGLFLTPTNAAAHPRQDVDAWNAAIMEYRNNASSEGTGSVGADDLGGVHPARASDSEHDGGLPPDGAGHPGNPDGGRAEADGPAHPGGGA